MTELAGVEVEVQTEQTGIESNKVQTHKDAEACVCKKDVTKNEMVMKKDKMICLFKRVECSEDEWEEECGRIYMSSLNCLPSHHCTIIVLTVTVNLTAILVSYSRQEIVLGMSIHLFV